MWYDIKRYERMWYEMWCDTKLMRYDVLWNDMIWYNMNKCNDIKLWYDMIGSRRRTQASRSVDNDYGSWQTHAICCEVYSRVKRAVWAIQILSVFSKPCNSLIICSQDPLSLARNLIFLRGFDAPSISSSNSFTSENVDILQLLMRGAVLGNRTASDHMTL